MRWWLTCCLGLLLCLATVGAADDRRGSPFDTNDHWEGYRTYRPERPRGWRERDLPDRFTVDKPGKCEVICQREGWRGCPAETGVAGGNQVDGGIIPFLRRISM